MADPASSSPSLTILGGPLAGRQFLIEETVDNVLIGSDPSCRFHVPLPGVSPIHARLWVDADGITVYDTNSPRGLHVNDDRVNGQSPIRNGDILWLGGPGDPEVVMIQCRVPSRLRRAAPSPEPVPADVGERETMALGTRPVVPPPPADAFEITEPPPLADVADEVTQLVSHAPEPTLPVPEFMVSAPPEDVTHAASEHELEQTTVLAAAQELEPAAPMEAPELPTLAPTLPPVPVLFEDETRTPTPPPMAPVPEPAPPAPVQARPAAPPASRPAAPARAEARAPRPRPAAPVARPAPPPAAPKSGGSAAGLLAAAGVVGFLVLAGAGYFAFRFLKSRGASPAPMPSPTLTVQATPRVVAPPPSTLPAVETPPPTVEAAPTAQPIVEETVPVLPATPPPTPSAKALPSATPSPAAAKPTPAPTKAPPATTLPAANTAEQLKAQQAAALLSQADAALAARRYDEAAGLYGQVQDLDPGSARAREGKASAQSAAAAARKAFVAGRTVVQSGRQSKGGMSGFEGAEVAKAPDYSGRIEFESSPRNPGPGDNYSVQVFLVNDGKKPFKIGSVSSSLVVNGTRAGGAAGAPPANEVKPQGRVRLQEIPGVWPQDVSTWSLEVTVTSDQSDTFKNTLTWR
jgi:hypothetical protein